MFIDTHTHLYLPEFDADRSQVVQTALDAGVCHLLLPNIDLSTIPLLHSMAARYPGCTSMAIGLHPTEVTPQWKDHLTAIGRRLLPEGHPYVAIGEIGLDLYWDDTLADLQMQALDRQLSLARSASLPVIIHCRKALPPMLEILEGHRDIRGVMHSFEGTVEDIEAVRSRADMYFGVNGIVTFKKSTVPALLPAIGINRILLETDSPYLSPSPYRGTRNDSSRIPIIARAVADTLTLPLDEVARATTANACSLFNLPVDSSAT